MSRTYRKSDFSWMERGRDLDDPILDCAHHTMSLGEVKEYSRTPDGKQLIRTSRYRKVKLVDKKHSLVLSSDGTFPTTLFDTKDDVFAESRKAKKDLKRIFSKRARLVPIPKNGEEE